MPDATKGLDLSPLFFLSTANLAAKANDDCERAAQDLDRARDEIAAISSVVMRVEAVTSDPDTSRAVAQSLRAAALILAESTGRNASQAEKHLALAVCVLGIELLRRRA